MSKEAYIPEYIAAKRMGYKPYKNTSGNLICQTLRKKVLANELAIKVKRDPRGRYYYCSKDVAKYEMKDLTINNAQKPKVKVTWLCLERAWRKFYGYDDSAEFTRGRKQVFKNKITTQSLPLAFTQVDNTIQVSEESIEKYKLNNSSILH